MGQVPHEIVPPQPSLRVPQMTPGGHDVAGAQFGEQWPPMHSWPMSGHDPQLKSVSQVLLRRPQTCGSPRSAVRHATGVKGVQMPSEHAPLLQTSGSVQPGMSQFRSAPQPLS